MVLLSKCAVSELWRKIQEKFFGTLGRATIKNLIEGGKNDQQQINGNGQII